MWLAHTARFLRAAQRGDGRRPARAGLAIPSASTRKANAANSKQQISLCKGGWKPVKNKMTATPTLWKRRRFTTFSAAWRKHSCSSKSCRKQYLRTHGTLDDCARSGAVRHGPTDTTLANHWVSPILAWLSRDNLETTSSSANMRRSAFCCSLGSLHACHQHHHSFSGAASEISWPALQARVQPA